MNEIAQQMRNYALSEEFVEGYLKSSQLHEQHVLDMIGNSTAEHLNLSQQIIETWENSLLVYIGNSQKIRLMHELFKRHEHTNILIGIST